jgi:hypothetical protein
VQIVQKNIDVIYYMEGATKIVIIKIYRNMDKMNREDKKSALFGIVLILLILIIARLNNIDLGK